MEQDLIKEEITRLSKDEFNIKEYVPADMYEVNINEIINVFNILLKEKLITEQEYQRAVNLATSKFKKV